MEEFNSDYDDRQMREYALKRLKKSKLLLVGLNGVGLEIAKNMILTGCKQILIHDEAKLTSIDLSSNFFCSEHDIGSNRVDCCLSSLRELNPYVTIDRFTGDLKEIIPKMDVIVFTDRNAHDESMVELNEIARKNNCKFIVVQTNGLAGSIFTDFGKNFQIFDGDGEPAVQQTIVDISNSNPGFVTVLLEKAQANHGLGIEDEVLIYNVKGMTELNNQKFKVGLGKGTKIASFTICDTTNFGKYVDGTGYCKKIKQMKTQNYLSLKEAIDSPPIIEYDFGKIGRGNHLHDIYAGLSVFQKKNGRMPGIYSEEDAKELTEIVLKINMNVNKDLVRLFSFTCQGNINPINALFGGFVAQEIFKAVTGKYTPLSQWWYYESYECLDVKNLPSAEDCKLTNTRYDGQICVFGKKFQEIINNQNIFLVGAGALGCEYLKNFSCMGIACSKDKNGKIHLTDMDNVEVSNLSRQFLFRKRHVGKMKADSAADSIRKLNTNINIISYVTKVAPSTECTFCGEFWDSIDCVVNAVDNLDARRYVDSKCVYYTKPLVEAGTEGLKANTQVIVPYLTENYSSFNDGREEADGMSCTIKNFPYNISHCISWGKDKLLNFMKKQPEDVNSFLQNKNFVKNLKKSENSFGVLKVVRKIEKSLVDKPVSFDDCVRFARSLFEKFFVYRINQLLHNFPIGSKDKKTGELFWTRDKRPPKPINFDITEKDHLDFIISAANIKAQVYGLKGETNFKYEEIISQMMIPDFEPKKKNIKVRDEDDDMDTSDDTNDDEKLLAESLNRIPNLVGFELNEIEFEKDDDKNFQMDFITACSNLRAENYGIPKTTKFIAKGIAVVTSTALITGLGCIELYKLIRKSKIIEDYRNTYVALALPSVISSEPVPPKKTELMGKKISYWDNITLDFKKDISMNQLLGYIKKTYNFEVESIAYGSALVYASFIGNTLSLDETVTKTCFTISKTTPEDHVKYLDFSICGVDEKEEDVEFPCVKYRLYRA